MHIRDFRVADFEQVFECYQRGFPEGHNRYSLARLVRWYEINGRVGTFLVAEEDGKVVGVIIGIPTPQRAWITGLTVLPEYRGLFKLYPVKLIISLILRFMEMGFTEAYATTGRPDMKRLADLTGAELISEEANFYFDGRSRWLYRISFGLLSKYQSRITKWRPQKLGAPYVHFLHQSSLTRREWISLPLKGTFKGLIC